MLFKQIRFCLRDLRGFTYIYVTCINRSCAVNLLDNNLFLKNAKKKISKNYIINPYPQEGGGGVTLRWKKMSVFQKIFFFLFLH